MDENDIIAELERIDRFFEGEEPGEVPLKVLRDGGMVIPDNDSLLDDAALAATLRAMIDELWRRGMVIEQTDHLSDRALYRWLVLDALLEEAILSDDGLGAWHLSPIGSGSEEDIEISLRYYFDDEEREDWERQFGGPLPPKEPLPYDRDRFLPGGEAGGEVQ